MEKPEHTPTAAMPGARPTGGHSLAWTTCTARSKPLLASYHLWWPQDGW